MGNQISQSFPPSPEFTEASLPNLSGKVYIVTGSSAGVGKELARLLYSRNGTVYVAARSAERGNAAIKWIKEEHPDSKGALHFLKLDLNDLEGIKPSAQEFLSREKRLDVLFNNAGVMLPPHGSTTKQGYELQLGTNCIAPFLFTKLLTPILAATAKISEPRSVRVVWVSSSAAHFFAPTGGVDMSNLRYEKDQLGHTKYGVSKGGNVLHAIEYARRHKDDGIVSISLNPGNLKSELSRHMPQWQLLFIRWILYPPVNGAYTELFAGLAPQAANLKEGEWVVPWGRIMALRKDYAGAETARQFWEWCEGEVGRYA